MTIGFKSKDFMPTGNAKRLPFPKPTLEFLEPGTPRYEKAKAAFTKAMAQQARS